MRELADDHAALAQIGNDEFLAALFPIAIIADGIVDCPLGVLRRDTDVMTDGNEVGLGVFDAALHEPNADRDWFRFFHFWGGRRRRFQITVRR